MAAAGRLIVILAADVAGYASLIEANEEGTRERLEAHRREFVFPKVAEHDGHVLKAASESLLVEFASAAEAVRCAVDLQRGMIARDIDAAPARRIAFRIGVDMGEMTATGDDLVSRAVAALPLGELATLIKPGTELYGGGVKGAVLVAALADAGGICISSAVWDAIRDELPYVFENIGKQSLDTGAATVHCYQMSAKAVAARQHLAAQNQRRSASRDTGLRRGAVAAGVFATVGIWGLALWAWLAASSTSPISAPVIVGSQTPSTSSAVGKGVRAAVSQAPSATSTADANTPVPSAPQPPLAKDTATDRAVRAAPPTQPPLPSDMGADRGAQMPVARPGPPDAGAIVVRGNQALSASDRVAAVVRGKQGESASQTMPDIGTAVVRGNQAPSPLQRAPDTGADVVRGTRAPLGNETTVFARRTVQGSAAP